MEQSQPPEKKKGCGCGGQAKVVYPTKANTPPAEQQEKLDAILQRINQRKNSIYKTRTRYFM